MKPLIVILVCCVILGYMWREQISAKVGDMFLSKPKQPTLECVVKGMDCADLVRMLNALRPGRYYEGASQLLGVSSEDDTLRRDGGVMRFTLDDGTIVLHNQGNVNLEKGYMTVKFPEGDWAKYDDKGHFVSEGTW